MSIERPILVLTASTGAGHTTAAGAVAAALRAAAPDQAVEVHDVLQSAGPFFRRLYGGGYSDVVQHLPALMGWLYQTMDDPSRHAANRLRTLIQSAFAPSVNRYLVRRRPKLIINTHHLSAEIAAHLLRRGRLDCPQVTITTDFETHRLWVQSPTERYYTATQRGKAYLTTWGVPAERIVVSGIPVRSGFEQPLQQRGLRGRLGLDPDRAVILLLSGGLGVGPMQRLLRELDDMPAEAQIVAIAGRNERLRRRLEVQVRGAARAVTVIGFTDRMYEWMRAADLAVTKPGGLTTAEALVCGLPMVIVHPIPGQETCNSDYLLEQGAAIKVNNPRLLGYHVSRLLASPSRLRSLRDTAQALGQPGAAARIAADALQVLAAHAGLAVAGTRKEPRGGPVEDCRAGSASPAAS